MADHIKKLRVIMKEKGIDWCLFQTADPHGSEYFCQHYASVSYISGFTGSNGILLVGMDLAYLWTDGRYFLQGEIELAGTEVTLMKMGEREVNTLFQQIEADVKKGQVFAADGFCVSASDGDKIKSILKKNGAVLAVDEDIAELVWDNRPQITCNSIEIVPLEYAGKSVSHKLKKLRKVIKEKGVDAILISALDDIMWLFNLRGRDVEYNPVAMSYAYVDKKKAILFVQKQAVTNELKAYAEGNLFKLASYERTASFLEKHITSEMKVLISPSLNFRLHSIVNKRAGHVVAERSPVQGFKAIKNKNEIAHLRDYFLKDSVALIKFLYWLDTEADIDNITEIDAADYLQSLRQEIDGYIEDSFETISAYGTNGAIVHYSPSRDKCSKLERKGFLLVDSGGQYKCATTDSTRTIVLGALSDDERRDFTLVAAGWVDLMNARFLEGCSGRNIDILARNPLWQRGIDYKHGTGHGIGCCLSVHEGPQNIRWAMSTDEAVLRKGMLVSDEPGVYVAGGYGIRTENTLLIKKYMENEYGSFLCFEPMTLVPIDRRAIDIRYLSDTQLKLINEYHSLVYDKTKDSLSDKERQWLWDMCKPIK